MFSSYDICNFSKRLSEHRKSLGYTREYVSKYTGINSDTIRKIEKGIVIPRFETLELLSNLYKINLLQLLDQYKSNTYLTYVYEMIDYHTVRNDKISLMNVIENFKLTLGSNNGQILIDRREYEQLSIYINAIEVLYGDLDNKHNISEELLIEAIRKTIPDFTLEKFSIYHYNQLELRLLYCLSSSLIYSEHYKLCIDILELILNFIDLTRTSTLTEKFIIIKALALISYSYYLMDNHEQSLYFAEKGIDFCQNNCIMDNLPLLLSRKGVALFNLKSDDYSKYLIQSVQLLQIQNNHELALVYKQIISKYGIEL